MLLESKLKSMLPLTLVGKMSNYIFIGINIACIIADLILIYKLLRWKI